MTGYKLPMEVEATIQHQAGEIMRLKAERDELVAAIQEALAWTAGVNADVILRKALAKLGADKTGEV